MEKAKARELMEVMAPRDSGTGSTFTDAKLAAFNSGYIDSYDEALDLLEQDIIVEKEKGKKK